MDPKIPEWTGWFSQSYFWFRRLGPFSTLVSPYWLSLVSSFCGSFRKPCECQTPSFQYKILESRFLRHWCFCYDLARGKIIMDARLSVLFYVSYIICVTVKLQVLSLFHCGIPPHFGRWFVQMENVLNLSLSIGWNFLHSKKPSFPVIVYSVFGNENFRVATH